MNSRRVSSGAVGLMLAVAVFGIVGLPNASRAWSSDIVLYASEAAVVKGNWASSSSSGAAGSRSMKSSDLGWSTTNAPQASPANYFEMTFDAPAATTYRVWLRLRAANNSKWNDAVWVQFSDSTTTSGTAVHRIGTTNGLLVNLERCSGCGMSGWGWQNTAYWLSQHTAIRFASTGKHTIRVQIREDGVEIDQIVLSPSTYLSSPPGPIINDTTILPKTTTSTGPTPYKGTPVALPGTVDAANFDNGGHNVAYYDTTAGNTGGAYRSTDVDLQTASGGGYNVGWTAAGEWSKYTVSVSSAAKYNVHLRVASTAAQTMQVSIGAATASVSVPNTGGWQAWQTVSVPMSLGAGQQMMTVKWTTGGVNLRSVAVAAASDEPLPPPPGSGVGGTFRMMTWNVHHGKDTNNVLSVPAQAKFIAAQGPHVVVLQEVQTWDQNQPLMFETELEKLTGVKWTRQWAPVVESAWTEGNVVLTRLDVVSSTYFQMHATSDWTVLLANRSVAQATVLVGGVAVDVFSTHLDYGNTTYRTTQLHQMMDWVRTFSSKRVVGGDFNSTPGTYWINTMLTEYIDTWQEVTGSSSGGGTINGVRFDYLFRSKDSGSTIKPTMVKVLSTTLSDHLPVIADYTVTP